VGDLISRRKIPSPVAIVETDRLLNFEQYAQVYPNRQGGFGVRASYIYQLYKAGKLPDNVQHMVVGGHNFIYVPEGHPLPKS